MNPVPAPLKDIIRPLARDLIQTVVWTLAIVSLVAVIAYPRAHAFGAELPFSMWAVIMPQLGGWFLFGIAIYFVGEYLRPYVAAGVSRRRFAAAAAIVLASAAAVFGLYAFLGFLAEGWWYRQVGWEQGFMNSGFLQERGAPALLGLEIFLRGIMLATSGLLVGWSYQALNAWLASFLLLFTAGLPFGLVSAFLDDPELVQFIGLDLGDWSQLARAIALLLAAGGLYLLVRTLLSRTALKARVP